MNFSRRKATQPRPPSPAFTKILASSMNCMEDSPQRTQRTQRVDGAGYSLRGWNRNDRYAAAVASQTLEFDLAVDERIQRPVFAHAHVAARMHDRADLPHQDVASLHELAVVALDPAPLSMRVATVARAALPFFMRHDAPS